jgi:hypothetical protein
MNTTILALALISLYGASLYSQEKAVTSAGKTIIVYPDGTWQEFREYVSTDKPEYYVRSKSSTAKVNILKGKATLYYNPRKWNLTKVEEGSQTHFLHKDGDVQAVIIAERIQMPIETLENVALGNAKKAAPDAIITLRETRRVNGLDILALQIKGNIQNTPFKYYNYYYSGGKGVIQVITFTSQNLFNEYIPDFEEFLNGLTIEP